jgi:hypothetical protein
LQQRCQEASAGSRSIYKIQPIEKQRYYQKGPEYPGGNQSVPITVLTDPGKANSPDFRFSEGDLRAYVPLLVYVP